MRWRVSHNPVGYGHLSQDRFKSFVVKRDAHFLTLCRYVERNALTAGLVERAEQWRYGSLYARAAQTAAAVASASTPHPIGALLSEWPIQRPDNWTELVNRPMTHKEVERVRLSMARVGAVLTAAPCENSRVATGSRQVFVDTNITGALILLEEAVAAGVESFVFTSTTSAFGDALEPPAGAPAAWVTEEVIPVPKNIYGATKAAAEDLCQLFQRNQGLACVVLRTSRFFPEPDDNQEVREAYSDDNAKVNEYL